MNLPTPSAPPVVKSALGAIGNEWGKFQSGLQNVGANIAKNIKAGRADFSINPLRGSGTAFRSAFKK
jgi:hypothetical protein